MIDILSNKLVEGLNGPLKENKFAMTLYSYLERAKNIPEERVIRGSIIANYQPVTDLFTDVKSTFTDWRFLNLFIKGVRRFPGDKYYSISFSSDVSFPSISKSCSAVFIGRNGVGKSSLFNGLEKIALGKLHSISFETFSSQDEPDYLRNIFTQAENVSIILETKNGVITSEGLDGKKSCLLPACFCSARDINNLLRHGVTKYFISEQLGLQKYWELLKSLSVINNELEGNFGYYKSLKDSYEKTKLPEFLLAISLESKDIDKQMINLLWSWRNFKRTYNSNRTSAIKKNIEKWRDKIEGILQTIENEKDRNDLNAYFFSGYSSNMLVNLSQNVDYINDKMSKLSNLFNKLMPTLDLEGDKPESLWDLIKKSVLDDLKNELVALEDQIEKLVMENPILEAKEEIIQAFINTYLYLSSEYQNILHIFKEQSDDIFKQLMESYFGDNIGKIYMDEADKFHVKIIPVNPHNSSDNLDKRVLPHQYLNTFRFKLYCVALKLSLAFYAKRLHQCNYPIILDDVFDSSDFSNKEKIKEFVEHVFEAHDKIFKDNPRQKNLQLIFFTQDEVVSEAVYRGILSLKKENNETKYSRIFNYKEAILDKGDETSDLYKRNVNNQETEFVLIEDVISSSYES